MKYSSNRNTTNQYTGKCNSMVWVGFYQVLKLQIIHLYRLLLRMSNADTTSIPKMTYGTGLNSFFFVSVSIFYESKLFVLHL